MKISSMNSKDHNCLSGLILLEQNDSHIGTSLFPLVFSSLPRHDVIYKENYLFEIFALQC